MTIQAQRVTTPGPNGPSLRPPTPYYHFHSLLFISYIISEGPREIYNKINDQIQQVLCQPIKINVIKFEAPLILIEVGNTNFVNYFMESDQRFLWN